MIASLTAQALPWFAVVLIALCAVLAMGVLTARSLFAMGMRLAALSALATGALLALGYGEGALTIALVGGGLAPTLLMGGVLLSARAAKPRKRRPWLSLVAVAACVVVMLWVAPDLALAPRAIADAGSSVLWLGVLAFVAASACAALLGYGERGVLEHARADLDA
jgi:hypothetical protein